MTIPSAALFPLAMGFVNPAMLAGLALIAAPIIIHLLSRRRYRRIEWGATRFLLEAEKETRRRVRFEQWLLLALRCLAMGLLALLVARPFLQPSALAALIGGRGAVARIIVIDDSPSVGYRLGTNDEFAGVRDAAHRLISWLAQESGGDRVSVYLTSQPAEPFIADARLDVANVQEISRQFEALRPTILAAQPRAVLSAVADALRADRAVARADIYILSDFQRTDWLAVNEKNQGPFEPLARLGQAGAEKRDIRTVLINSARDIRPNIGVLDIAFERAHRIAAIPTIVKARVANFGPRRVDGLSARVEVDGAAMPPAPVPALDPDSEQTVSLEVAFPDAGYHELAISLAGADGLPGDDARRVSTNVLDALSVLLVNGEPSADPQSDEVHLLRSALAPPGPFSSGNRVEVIDPKELEGTVLDHYDCVVLCNIPPLPQTAVEHLERFVRAGGGMAFFLGQQAADAEAFNSAFFKDGRGLLPLAVEHEVTPTESAAGVGLVRATQHPVTTIFPAGGDTLSEYVHFRKYLALGSAARTSATSQPTSQSAGPVVIATYADAAQTPAIIENTFGAGSVLTFTSTADLDWNDWPRASDGSYVVTMLEAVQYLARRDPHPLQCPPGRPLIVSVSADAFEPTALFRSPAYPQEPTQTVVGRAESTDIGAPLVFSGPSARALGAYRVDLTPRSGGTESRPLCVNLDSSESDLRSASSAELDAALVGIPHEFLKAGESFTGDNDQTRREMWRSILVLVVAILMGEQWLAWWFGGAIGRSGATRRNRQTA